MGSLAEVFVLTVSYDADDFEIRVRWILAQTDALAEGVLASEQRVRAGFVDDGDTRGAWPIAVVEIPPGEKRGPGRPEVAWRDVVQNRGAPLVWFRDGQVGARDGAVLLP